MSQNPRLPLFARNAAEIGRLRDRTESLLTAIASTDLAGHEARIVLASELGDLAIDENLHGYAAQYLNLMFSDLLAKRSRGPVVSVFINDLAIARAPSDAGFQTDFRAAAIHEMAHALTWPLPWEATALPAPEAEMTRAALRAEMTAFRDSPAEPWEGHDAPVFCRMAIHLVSRAAANHCPVPVDFVCGGLGYRLSPGRTYAALLGDEPRRMADRPLRDIIAGQPPERFWKRWRDDKWMYLHFRKPRHERQRDMQNKVFDDLAADLAAEQAQHAAEFKALAAQIADGEVLNARQAKPILAAAGKTVADLRREVDAEMGRRLKAHHDASFDRLTKEKDESVLFVAARDAELKAAQDCHAEAVRRPLAIIAEWQNALPLRRAIRYE